ncbi:hypothetical protein [Intrasporangium sp.]|uniref:hypothetical protein n=1 Tax=Intrasporangium sp. TaxID=1925024 RepID=UPI003221CEE7
MPEIAGSLWSVSPSEQVAQVERLKDLGLRRLHWDTTDGRFASPGGFTAEQARQLTQTTGLAAEAHLMVQRPLREVDAWADFCDLVVVHAESDDWDLAVDRIARRGCRPGVAISPQTPVTVVPDDLVALCMSIVPGTAGSAFDESVLLKVQALHAASPTRRIGVDGGIQRRHADRLSAAGAGWLVVGTDLFSESGAERWAGLLATRGT